MKNINLSIGAKGEAVKKLHSILIQTGLRIPEGEQDTEFFGVGTQKALKRWQKSNKLKPTGEVDTETASKMGIQDEKGEVKKSDLKVTSLRANVSREEINEEVPKEKTNTIRRLSGRQKKRLVNLTLGITNETEKEQLEELFIETAGDFKELNKRLAENSSFEEETIKKLSFNNELSDLLEDDEELITVFVTNEKTNSLRDIALSFKKEDLKSYIRTENIPDDIEGENEEERLEKFTDRINDRLFHMEPTGVIHRMVRDKEIDNENELEQDGLLSFFDTQPELDFKKASVLTIFKDPESLKPIPEGQREAVANTLKKLQRLSSVSTRAAAVPVLLNLKLHSAYAINEIPMKRFVSQYADSLGGVAVARSIHRNANAITARNEEAYIALRNSVFDPGIYMINGGSSSEARMGELSAFATDNNLPINFETLFGSADLCECSHCNSVYSPAAYLVELFQYLRNNNLDPENVNTGDDEIKGTPLEKFFRRRPDLGDLQLTCENTNTLIPYIDLVNEVMESFVVHLDDYEEDTNIPKQTDIKIQNVDNETSGELLAEPQHTNYGAYKVLKDTVYPVCKLPYHQPIDATRQYLDFLGTSRYELFKTFRKDVSIDLEDEATPAEIETATQREELQVQSVANAIASEYLNIIEEEYVILTKNGFHSQEWYELSEGTNLTLTEYRDIIGLKNTWDYYGIDSEAQMVEELKWVKPEQKTGIVGFLRRTNTKYVDLIELLKTKYINPNYPSGKDLAYMNSLRYSYRYLQSLVDNTQTDITLRYQTLVQFLQKDLNENLPSPFTGFFVACWTHRLFEKIGKIIVLDNGSDCKCIEGRIQLEVRLVGESQIRLMLFAINENCEIISLDNDSVVGRLETNTGQLVIDTQLLNIDVIILALFNGSNGEVGTITLPDLTLHVQGQLMTCMFSHENCDISKTQLKHLDGTDLETEEYDRMHRFIRLWCKMGWNIDEVDQAITGIGEAADHPILPPNNFAFFNSYVALLPSLDPINEDSDTIDTVLVANPVTPITIDDFTSNPNNPDPDNGLDDLEMNPFNLDDCVPEPISQVEQEITPYLIEQLAAIKKLLEITGLDLPKLLTYWTTIGIYGEKALYKKLFLQYNLVAIDEVFIESDFGTYLTDEEETINNHIPVLMSALKVDAATIEAIMNLASIGEEEVMTMENVSIIYRYTLLLKTLGLRITELSGLLTLTKNTAFPFGKPTQTLEFYKLFFRIENSGFSLRELNYILLDEDDPQRSLKPGMGDIFRLTIELRDMLLEIETAHANIQNGEEVTEELLRSKLGLIYDGDTTEKIISLLQGTTVYTDNTRRKFSTQFAQADHEAITEFLLQQLKNEEDEPGTEFQNFLQRVKFSATKGIQITGVLNDEDKGRVDALASLISDTDDEDNFQIVTSKMYLQPVNFFDDVLTPIFNVDSNDAKDVLLAEDIVNTEDQNLDTGFIKRGFFAKYFMSYLREELRKRLVLQTMSSEMGLDMDVTRELVMDVIQTEEGISLYSEIIKLKEQTDSDAIDQNWEGFFVPEKDGKYTFLLEAEGDATLTIKNRIQWEAAVMTDDEGINFYQSEPRFLKAGRAYKFLLEGYDEDDDGNIIGLFMKFNNQPKAEVTDKVLFPALRTEAFAIAFTRLQKSAMLVSGFDISLVDLEFFLEFPSKFGDVDFNTFTFSHWLRLESFYRFNKSISSTTLSLVEFLEWTNNTEVEEDVSLVNQIQALTGWEKSEIFSLIRSQHFNLNDVIHFQDEIHLQKLQETLKVAKKIGAGIGNLFKWGTPTSIFSTNRKRAGNIREVIRARYTQSEWEEAIKPVHDKLRENQKQALIAYLLAQPVLMEWGVVDADSLFEFFLIDVQMDACMETSRIKQAISSIQLYVQRCFLGLEEKHGMQPNMLDAERWEWMQRYRVWEANRKVYLYPENWIEPELRDSKSPFFEELESELLQNDVSKDTVKAALTKYIVHVDEVANLEVVGQYLEGNKTSGTLHVIGRTRNAPYFFYYRYYEYENKYWYPWEKVEVDIPSRDIENSDGKIVKNGAYVIPVVWKDRLFIFFPEFMQKKWNSSLANEQSISDNADSKISENIPITYWEIKMSWSEYKEGKWTPKTLSNEAIYTIENIELDVVNDGIDGNIYPFLFDNPSKFIFSSLVNESRIIINIFYTASELTFLNEFMTNEGYNLEKLKWPGGNNAHPIKKSFRFNGSHIAVQNRPNSAIPERRDYDFHYVSESGNKKIYPLQSSNNAIEPDDITIPVFDKINDSSSLTIKGSDSYIYSHISTKNILGLLRKGRLNKVFNIIHSIIPLSDDNYGSNSNIAYHELLRPYAIYNWEMLFHSVGMLAENLSKSQRFEESMQWWHYIFDPRNVDGGVHMAWKFLPFRATDSKNTLDKIFSKLTANTADDKINAWRENPFNPHLIARDRPSAYMKWVVMKYIDNSIAWADSLFRQDTIESINQATQLYILASHILGPRPEMIPKRGKIQPKSYKDMINKWDAFSNAIVDLELIFPFSNQINMAAPVDEDGEPHYVNIYGFATTMYFCIPNNPKLLKYWDTVADRLFKIRHCMNIDGVVRSLALFEPPIDPALLVLATSQGLSIGNVLNDLSTSMPNYRFNYLLQRALEITSEVKSMGSALLSALEKKDSESLSVLRAQHDTHIQNLITEVRELQLEETEKNLESLKQNRKAPEYRLNHYLQLAGEEVNIPAEDAEFTEVENNLPTVKEESGMKLIPEELESVKKSRQSINLQISGGVIQGLVGILHLFPELNMDIKPIGIGAGFSFSGTNLGNSLEAAGRAVQIASNITSAQSQSASQKAGFTRQFQDRIFQANVAGHELMQIDKQITAQKIRKEIAQKELDNHRVQIEQTKETEEFLRSKFSNEQLYQWMSDRLKSLYYQTYSFAYDLAKKAEKVYRFEMGLSTTNFIKFGYWDSSKEGFLAGEQLYLALKQLGNAYVETKPHDYEITKHISLQQLNPLALILLKEEGACEFDLPEEIFDLDYAGHYKRRIKTVSVSIPCIAGPYTSLNCTLRLLNHEYRNSKLATSASDYAKKLEEADERFIYNPIPTTAIAVSQGQNDSGVFELNFKDERYLPFEGAGAVSRWRLELPQEFHQFDYQTITDIVVHLRYTSCEGGGTLKSVVLEHLTGYVEEAASLSKQQGLFRMLSIKHEFPDEWHRLLHPESDIDNPVFILGNLRERLPFFANSQKVSSIDVHSIMLFTQADGLTINVLKANDLDNLDTTNAGFNNELGVGALTGGLNQYITTDQEEDIDGLWGLQFVQDQLDSDTLKNAWLVVKYQITM